MITGTKSVMPISRQNDMVADLNVFYCYSYIKYVFT